MSDCECTWCSAWLDGKCNYIQWCLDHWGVVGDMTIPCDEIVNNGVVSILPHGYIHRDVKRLTGGDQHETIN